MSGSSGDGLLSNYRITESLRDEGRNGAIRIERLTTGGEIGQGIALLLLTAQQHRQHGRDKATAALTLRAKADFAPQDRAAQTLSAALLVGSIPSTRTNVHNAASRASNSRHVAAVFGQAF